MLNVENNVVVTTEAYLSMNHITTTDLLEHLKSPYATKQFAPSKTISAEVWTALENALVLSPSSYGLQPWKFLVVTRSELKE